MMQSLGYWVLYTWEGSFQLAQQRFFRPTGRDVSLPVTSGLVFISLEHYSR